MSKNPQQKEAEAAAKLARQLSSGRSSFSRKLRRGTRRKRQGMVHVSGVIRGKR